MHTCGTSTSPPSSVQQVWWRDGLDLQHDAVVYMVENFCSRALPPNSREGERRAAGRLGLEGKVWGGGWCAPSPLYIEGWAAATLAPSPKPNRRPQGEGVGGKETPLLEGLSRV